MQNNPGGGGLVTANRLYVNAEKDGTVLAKLERAVPQLAIQGNPNAQFDPMKLTWLGSLSSYADDAYLMLVNANHTAKTVADLKRPGVSVALAPTSGVEQPVFRPSPRSCSASTSTSCAAIPARRRCSWPCSVASSTARWSA